MMTLDMAGKTIEVTSALLESLKDGSAKAFSEIGIGIGAIMLLVCATYYIVSILDGGKFQMKMLFPLLIFMFVCNFSWVSTPAVSFVTTITKSLSVGMAEAQQAVYTEHGGEDCSSISDLFWKIKLEKEDSALIEAEGGKDDENLKALMGEGDEENDGGPVGETESSDEEAAASAHDSGGLTGKLMQKIRDGLHMAWVQVKADLIRAARFRNGPLRMCHVTFSGILVYILQFFVKIFAVVLQCLGVVLTAVTVLFGPLTFGFAVFPGRSNTMMTWFLRLCQFSLYGPICGLVNLFTLQIFVILATGGNGFGGFLIVLAVLIVNLILLTSVPTIASMIIEGASGAVSLSQGLQIMSGAMSAGATAVAATVKGPAALLAGQNNRFSNFFAGMKERGLTGFINEVKQTTFDEAMRTVTAQGQAARRFGSGDYPGPSGTSGDSFGGGGRSSGGGGRSAGGGGKASGAGGVSAT